MPEEVVHALDDMQSHEIVLARRDGGAIRRWAGDLGVARRDPIYLTDDGESIPRAEAAINIAQLGWCVLDLPDLTGDVLTACSLGAKSDWFDVSTGGRLENRRSFKVFAVALRSLQASLKYRSMLGVNIESGASVRYPHVGCSEQAWRWRCDSGGRLQQADVANVEFKL